MGFFFSRNSEIWRRLNVKIKFGFGLSNFEVSLQNLDLYPSCRMLVETELGTGSCFSCALITVGTEHGQCGRCVEHPWMRARSVG